MTYVEKLQKYIDDNGIVDIKFDIPEEYIAKDIPIEEKIERIAEISYKLLSGEFPSTEVDFSEVDF